MCTWAPSGCLALRVQKTWELNFCRHDALFQRGWGEGYGIKKKKETKVISDHADSQKEWYQKRGGKWSPYLPQQFKMGKMPSNQLGPRQRTAFPRANSNQKCSSQQETVVFQKLTERWLGFPAPCQLPPSAILPAPTSSLQFQGIPIFSSWGDEEPIKHSPSWTLAAQCWARKTHHHFVTCA